MSTYPQVVDVPALQSELGHARDEAARANRELAVERSKAEGLRGQLANAEVAMRLANVGSERDLRQQLSDLTASHREQEVSDSMTIRTLRADRVALLEDRRALILELARERRTTAGLREEREKLYEARRRLSILPTDTYEPGPMPDHPGDSHRPAGWPEPRTYYEREIYERVDAKDRGDLIMALSECDRAHGRIAQLEDAIDAIREGP